MASCFIGPEIQDGLQVFKEVFRTSGDFVKASTASVKYLNDKGVTISAEEFNTFAENNFKSLVPKADGFFRHRKGKMQDLSNKVQRELGITGKYTAGKEGKYKAGKISAEAQETLQEAVDIGYAGKESSSAFITDGENIGTLIKDATKYEDPSRLEEALRLIKEVRANGETALEKKNKERTKNLRTKADKAASSISRLSIEHQKSKDRILQFKADNAKTKTKNTKDDSSTIENTTDESNNSTYAPKGTTDKYWSKNNEKLAEKFTQSAFVHIEIEQKPAELDTFLGENIGYSIAIDSENEAVPRGVYFDGKLATMSKILNDEERLINSVGVAKYKRLLIANFTGGRTTDIEKDAFRKKFKQLSGEAYKTEIDRSFDDYLKKTENADGTNTIARVVVLSESPGSQDVGLSYSASPIITGTWAQGDEGHYVLYADVDVSSDSFATAGQDGQLTLLEVIAIDEVFPGKNIRWEKVENGTVVESGTFPDTLVKGETDTTSLPESGVKAGGLEYADIAEDLRILGISIDGASELDPAELAFRVLSKLAIKERPLWPRFITSFRKKFQQTVLWENFDLGSYLSVIDKRGAKDADGGILANLIEDPLRKADSVIRVEKENAINTLGLGLAKIFGKEFTRGKAPWSGVRQHGNINKFIKQKAYESTRKIETSTILQDGTIWEPTAGELAQLYLDSFDPNAAAAIERAGITMDALKEAVSQLTEQELAFAKWVQTDFYPSLYEKENAVYKRMYNTRMPFNSSYGGPISYVGDTEVDAALNPNGAFLMDNANATLSNAIEQVGSNRPININRNVFSNVLGRLDNSAKFTGGAETYNEINGIINDPKVVKSLNTAHFNGSTIRQKLNAEVESTFGLSRTLPKLPNFVQQLTSNITFVALALKPKLLLNQVTSSLFWMLEASTYEGISGNKQYEQELKTGNGNIVNAMFNNSPIIRARYTRTNLIGLTSSLNEQELGADALRKGNEFKDFAASLLMSPTLLGDAVGVFVGGKQYFLGEYIKARKAGMTEADAATEAGYRFGKKLSKTQQSFLKFDKADIQNGDWRIFTQFGTAPRQFRRIIADDIRQLYRAIHPRKETKGSPGYHVARTAMLHSVAGGMYYVVMHGLPAILLGWDDDDDEEKFEKFFATEQGAWSPWLMGSYSNSIFLLGDAIDAVRNEALGAKWDTNVGESSAFIKLNKAKDEFLKIQKYGDMYSLNANQKLAYQRAQWNAWAYLAEGMGRFPSKSLGLTKGQSGDLDIVNMYKAIESGDWDNFEFLLRRFGYSEYQVQEGSGPKAPPTKTKKFGGSKKSFGGKKSFGNKKKKKF